LNQNIKKCSDSFFRPFWYKAQVKKGGPWDFKKYGLKKYEEFGNFHFGATCYAMGFPEIVCLSEAGKAQSVDNPGQPKQPGIPYLIPPFGDQSVDQYNIERGFDYAKKYSKKAQCGCAPK